jgi:hypothetical protein
MADGPMNLPGANSAFAQGSYTNDSDANGRRVRLRPKPVAVGEIIGGSPLLAILKETGGMVWPYQPMITYNQEVEYQSVEMVHTNQELYAYKRTPAVKLTVEGEWTVQNQKEGKYALACLHFLRTVTKMYFGQGANIGTPPPVLLFDAYGQYMFNRLPVIVTAFTPTLPKDVDYVPINVDVENLTQWNIKTKNPLQGPVNGTSKDGYVWLPAVFSITVTLTVQNTPSRLRQFNLNDFRNGTLLKNPNGGWI